MDSLLEDSSQAASNISAQRGSSRSMLADPVVSRLHCRVFMLDGTWCLEDGGSTHGTRVLRGADDALSCVFDSGGEKGPRAFPLEFGDRIVLAGRITYWFCARDAHVLTIG